MIKMFVIQQYSPLVMSSGFMSSYNTILYVFTMGVFEWQPFGKELSTRLAVLSLYNQYMPRHSHFGFLSEGLRLCLFPEPGDCLSLTLLEQ